MLKKNIFASFGLVLAIFFFGNISVLAQSNQSFSAPKRLRLKGDEKEATELYLIRSHFYPIGWSKDGKFAYLVEPPDEACGCYMAHLVIQDLRSDKILWEKDYQGDEEKEETLQSFWKQNQKEFSRKLNEHKIVAQKQFSIQSSAFTYQGDRFTPELKVDLKTDGSLGAAIGDMALSLVSKQKGRKTIYETKFTEGNYEPFLGAELSGSLLSPFEARAAVIVIERYRGYEGPPHTTQVRIVGADLLNAFRKQ